MIKVEQITKVFKKPALSDVSFTVSKGSCLALLGPNGAGKTTLFRLLSSLSTATEGSISIDGMQVCKNNRHIKGLIGYVPQHINLEQDFTVNENLMIAAKLFGVREKNAKERIRELLDFALLGEKSDEKVRTLSGGMKRKLLLVRAMLHDPDIFLLDEPTVGLDLPYRKTVWKLIKELKAAGKTVVIATHYLEEAQELCDTLALIKEGELFFYGSKEELFLKLGAHAVSFDGSEGSKLFSTKEAALKFMYDNKAGYYRKADLEDIFEHYMV